MAVKQEYGNDSIKSLKGAERVRQKPAVIFGSDGIEGCQHSIFEIMSNSIDEAREGRGDKIIITRYADLSIIIKMRKNITGSYYSVSYMPEVNMTKVQKIMSTHSA